MCVLLGGLKETRMPEDVVVVFYVGRDNPPRLSKH